MIPASPTTGDPCKEAVEVVVSLLEIPSAQWLVEIAETYDVSDVESIK